jgi:acyl-CoA thioester hydrolase
MAPYKFSISMTVRTTDLNYGNHVGYQTYFSYFQEARSAYLGQFGYTELDIEGYGMIIGEANCRYKRELFLNDCIRIACCITEIKSKRFVMQYEISNKEEVCAEGFTKILCYDYQAREVVQLPDAFVSKIQAFEQSR